MRPNRWAESWHCLRRTANRPGSQRLGQRQKWPRLRTVSNGARAADGNRPQSGKEYQGAPGPRSPLRKSLDDAVLPSYSSTILPMNTKIFFPIWFLSLPVMAAGSSPPKFRAVEIDTKIEIGYGVAVADVDGDGKPD